MDKRRLTVLFLVVLVDVFGFGLILPLLPYYAKSFGAGPVVIGVLTASYAAAQLFGAPILGRLSDRFGRRPVLVASIAGTALGFLVLGLARSLWMLFLGRIIDGVTGGNVTVAQAYIADVSNPEHRGQALGLIGASFGIGFILGPATGGLLSRFGYAVPALVAAGVAFLNMLAVAAFLPESLSDEQKRRLEASPRHGFSVTGLVQALRRPRVGPLLDIRLFFGLAFAMFQTIFSLWALTRLHVSAQTTGLVLSYVGVLSIATQAFLIKPLDARFTDAQLIVGGTLMAAVSFLGWALVPNLPLFLLLLLPLNVAIAVLNTILSSALSKAVYPEEIGGVFGLAGGIQSLTLIVAPVLGGVLLARLGAWSPGVFSALVVGAMVPYAYVRLIAHPDAPLPAREDDRPEGEAAR
jgi:DHA1 family tetracycline resistance protein-like MFS transporter